MKVKWNATTLAVTAVMIALVTVATGFLPRIPIPASGGYIHLGDIFVFFSAFAFGPVIGAIVGGVGCALADILGGYAVWAPLSLVAHGLQGFVAGLIAIRSKSLGNLALAWVAGWICGAGVYFVGEALIPAYGGLAGATAELIPGIFQFGVGGLVGIILYLLVRRAYPPIDTITVEKTWEEG